MIDDHEQIKTNSKITAPKRKRFLLQEIVLQMAVLVTICLATFIIQLNFQNFLLILSGHYFILESWQKINGEEPVCFGAKDNFYGSFNMTKSGRVKTMKLIHRSGTVLCNPTADASYWGCAHSNYGRKLMTIITDADKKPVFPPAEDLNKDSYSLPGYQHNSPELVFRSLVTPLSVSSNQEMQIWYGQDWKDHSEENNSGKTCVDVYAWYA